MRIVSLLILNAVLSLMPAIGQTPQTPATLPDAAVLQSLAGRYEFKKDLLFDITLEDGTLKLKAPGQEKASLEATGELSFKVKETPGVSLTFQRDTSGNITGLVLHQNGDHKARRIGGAPPPSTATVDLNNFDAYVGEYEVQPGFVLTVTNEKGKLLAQPTGDARVELKHDGGARFSSEEVGALLEFARDDAGVVRGVTINMGGQVYKAKKIK